MALEPKNQRGPGRQEGACPLFRCGFFGIGVGFPYPMLSCMLRTIVYDEAALQKGEALCLRVDVCLYIVWICYEGMS